MTVFSKEASRSSLKLFLVFVSLSLLLILFLKTQEQKKIFLWAWERPENLSFIDPHNINVIYYAGSVVYKNGALQMTPRLQPLLLPSGTATFPIIRMDNFGTVADLQPHIGQITRFIKNICLTAAECQLDFDARVSERDFYRQLLTDLRSQLRSEEKISMTGLLSWCDSGSWIKSLPIDRVVPMFYRIGADSDLIRKNLTGSSFMKMDLCHDSAGISTDEPLPDPKYIRGRDIYIFDPRPWTANDFKGIIGKITAVQ